MAAVLKTAERKLRGFESLSLRQPRTCPPRDGPAGRDGLPFARVRTWARARAAYASEHEPMVSRREAGLLPCEAPREMSSLCARLRVEDRRRVGSSLPAVAILLAAACLTGACAPPPPPAPSGTRLRFSPEGEGSRFAPRFAPAIMRAPLIVSGRKDLPGADPLEGFLEIGPKLSATEPGFAVVLARGQRQGPWDLLYAEGGEGQVQTPVHADSVEGGRARPESPGVSREGSADGSSVPPGTAHFTATLEVPHLEGRFLRSESSLVEITVEPGPEGAAPSSMSWIVVAAKAARVTVAGRELTVLLADGDSDGIFGPGDPWLVTENGDLLAAPFTADTAREVGETAWAAGRPWRLRLTGTAGKEGFLEAGDIRGSPAEDEERHGSYPADRAAPRAAAPLRCAPGSPGGGEGRETEEPAPSRAAIARPRLIVFTAPGCAQCETMERLVFSARAVVEAANGIDCVRIDALSDPGSLRERSLTGVPAGVLLDVRGREIDRYEGYAGVARLAALLRKAQG